MALHSSHRRVLTKDNHAGNHEQMLATCHWMRSMRWPCCSPKKASAQSPMDRYHWWLSWSTEACDTSSRWDCTMRTARNSCRGICRLRSGVRNTIFG